MTEIAAKRKPHELLRSIIAPSADIEPKYVSQTVVLDSGKVVVGLLIQKTPEKLVLFGSQQKEIEIPLSEIDEVAEQKLSIMPEITKTLTRREIRDVVAYLVTLSGK